VRSHTDVASRNVTNGIETVRVLAMAR